MKAEIIALRHQVSVLQRTQKTKRLRLNPADRWLWVCLSGIWSGWRAALIIVKPETVISWHRKAFLWYWTWKIRHGQPGRPRIPKETRDLIRTMSQMNVLWGAPRIHSELLSMFQKARSRNTWSAIQRRHLSIPNISDESRFPVGFGGRRRLRLTRLLGVAISVKLTAQPAHEKRNQP